MMTTLGTAQAHSSRMFVVMISLLVPFQYWARSGIEMLFFFLKLVVIRLVVIIEYFGHFSTP